MMKVKMDVQHNTTKGITKTKLVIYTALICSCNYLANAATRPMKSVYHDSIFLRDKLTYGQIYLVEAATPQIFEAEIAFLEIVSPE